MATTNIDIGTSLIEGRVFEDVTVTFAGADTFVDGTIMARKSSAADTYTGVITGTGTRVAVLSAPQGRMRAGTYTLVAGTLASGVGRWTMTAPDGKTEVYTALAATENLSFPSLGVLVDINDSGTNYVTADSVVFTVVAGGKMVPFAVAGANGAQYPAGVLTYDLTKSGSGDLAARVLVEGIVRKERLVIDAGTAVTSVHLDALRATGITAESCAQLGRYDNPQ